MLQKAITKNSTILAAFAAATALLIAITFQSTKAKIGEQQRLAAQKALKEIIPESLHDNDLLATTHTLSFEEAMQFGIKEPLKLHIATLNGDLSAIAIPAIAPDGYSGDINMLIGIDIQGQLTGVRVLNHKETPGLGDKIDLKKSDWILGFNGKSLSNPTHENWAVKKDGGEFDQFTGATITPRAIVKRIKQTLEIFNAQHSTWLEVEKIPAEKIPAEKIPAEQIPAEQHEVSD